MGSWSLIGATPSVKDRDDVYGNFFSIRFKLKYTPSKFGKFKEMPLLEWKEVIFMKLHHDRTYWKHPVDQYQRDPRSKTFKLYVGRYRNWFDCVRTGAGGGGDLYSIKDLQGRPVPKDAFPRLSDSQKKAEFVRGYLQRYGGVVEILVNDSPAILTPTPGDGVDKERVLTFDCGFKGLGMRTFAYQYLHVRGAVGKAQWERKCEVSRVSVPMSVPDGYREVPAPQKVSAVKPFGAQTSGDYR